MNEYVIYTGIFLAVLVMAYIGYKKTKNEFFLNVVEKIKGFLLNTILEAEMLYKSGTGQFKKAYVVNTLLNCEFYTSLPSFIQKLITFELLSRLIDNIVESVFNKVKDSNKNLQNIIDG